MNNTVTQEGNKHQELKNKGFSILHDLCIEHGWHMVINEMTHLTYTKVGDETTTFAIQVTPNKLIVSVPLKNSVYQYTTSFASYYEASEYVEQRFFDYLQEDQVTRTT